MSIDKDNEAFTKIFELSQNATAKLQLGKDAFKIDADKENPTKLYHYTTIEGMQGILNAGGIWATNINFLNDYQEYKLGQNLLLDVIEEKQEQYKHTKDILEIIKVIDAEFRSPLNKTRPYVACFCSEGDLLSQWRGYADKGGGYSLEFELDTLGSRDSQFAKEPVNKLYKIIYDKNIQKSLLSSTIDIFCESRLEYQSWCEANSINKSSYIHELGVHHFISLLEDELAKMIHCFKHEGFKEEKEYRLVGLYPTKYEIDRHIFRTNNGTLIPCVNIGLNISTKTELGKYRLSKIIYGPTLSEALVKESLELWKSTLPYPEVKIEGSPIPFQQNFSPRR